MLFALLIVFYPKLGILYYPVSCFPQLCDALVLRVGHRGVLRVLESTGQHFQQKASSTVTTFYLGQKLWAKVEIQLKRFWAIIELQRNKLLSNYTYPKRQASRISYKFYINWLSAQCRCDFFCFSANARRWQ